MGESDSPKNEIFAILDRELEELEKSAFDSTDQDILDARSKMLDAMSTMGLARYNLGLAVRNYQKIYMQNGEEEWRDRADEKIAQALGYNVKSVKNLIDDAERADQIGEELRNAMVARGYDPAAAKNQDIVIGLPQKPPWPRTLKDALALVDRAISSRSDGNTNQNPDSDARRQQRLVNRVAELVIDQPRQARRKKFTEVFDQVKNVLVAERTKAVGGADSQGGAPVPTVDSGTLKRPGSVAVPKPARPGVSVTGSSRPARKASATAVRHPQNVHPWGDACLNTLRFLDPGPAGRKSGEFHRKLLYDVRDNLKPTRYLVAGMIDLFDPGVPDKVFDEHLNVFLQASRHTFLALTPHADSVRRHWERWKKMNSGVGFPVNFWTGVSVDCVDHLKRMRILRETGMRTQWASFVDYHSDASRPLSTSSFRSDIGGTKLVVFGWDFANPQSPLSPEDACSLARAAVHSGTGFFFTHPKSKQAFLTGTPPVSELPAATKPRVKDPNLEALIDRAQSSQNLPREWFGHADWARKPHFKGFEGEEVELFDYESDIGDGSIAMGEAS